MRVSKLQINIGTVKVRPIKGKLWVTYINENYFDSYGCPPPKVLLDFVIN